MSLDTATDILTQLSQVTQNVPYMQVVSNAILYIVKIHEVCDGLFH